MKNRTTSSQFLPLIVLMIALMFTGCGAANSDSQIRSLENDISSLKKSVSSLENSLDEMQKKNTALETKVQTLEEQVNGLKLSSH